MENLPIDIGKLIFINLTIIDSKQLMRCNKKIFYKYQQCMDELNSIHKKLSEVTLISPAYEPSYKFIQLLDTQKYMKDYVVNYITDLNEDQIIDLILNLIGNVCGNRGVTSKHSEKLMLRIRTYVLYRFYETKTVFDLLSYMKQYNEFILRTPYYNQDLFVPII